MDEQVAALGEMVLIQQKMLHEFIRRLITHLDDSVPDFDLAGFAETLALYQQHLPSPQGEPQADLARQADLGLREWAKLARIVEEILAERR